MGEVRLALATPNLEQAVGKAMDRAETLGVDLTALSATVRDALPDVLNSEREKRQRRAFLESLYDENRDADAAFERIIAGNELQDANFLARGALVARAVVRIVLKGPGGALRGYGTGFMIGDGVLITNNHVLGNRDVAAMAEAQAFYERDILGHDSEPQRFSLAPQTLFYTSRELDFTIVAVEPVAISGGHMLADLGWLPLLGMAGKAVEGEWLTIVQHPRGERKQLCVRENQLIKRDTDVLWYSTDTLAGSSGSPVFNNDWLLVALHHSGVPKTKDGKWQTADGRDYDRNRDSEDSIAWEANEGIRVSRIVETLRTDATIADHPAVRAIVAVDVGDVRARLPVFFRDGRLPAAAMLPAAGTADAPRSDTPLAPKEDDMAKRQITVTLEIDDDGSVAVVGRGAREADLIEKAASPKKPEIDAPVVPEEDWLTGYDPQFLDSALEPVNLPAFSNPNAPIAPLLEQSVYGFKKPDAATAKAGVLHYRNFSVVMHKDRRVAFYSAANIDGGVHFPGLSRTSDRWLRDKRIAKEHQIENEFYTHNKIDRGHLTRREDLEWGVDPVDATRRANGTCTWTNCSPQHELFNQDKSPDPSIRLWHGLEKYILEQTARQHRFKVQAFTGPIFGESDPLYRKVRIPLDFWKVVVAVDAEGALFATGYILSQRDVLVVTDLDEAALDVPFGKFQTYQRTLAEIEEATGLLFTYGNALSLSAVDPLAKELKKPVWKRAGRGASSNVNEAFGTGGPLDPDAPLTGHGEIFLG